MHKSTNAEIDMRVQEVYTLLSQGYRYVDILRYCREKYKVKADKTIDIYIANARKIIQKNCEKSMETIRQDANERYDELYIQARKAGRLRDAAYIQSRKDKINGLDSENLIISGGIKVESDDISEAEIDKKIKLLLQAAKKK